MSGKAVPFVALIALLLVAPGVRADEASRLALADQHLQAVEFDAARAAAHAAIESGKLEVKELARAYEIIGVSAAAVGNNEEARAAYLRLLALDADARPSDILPPEKNRVFYDAQGFWHGRAERFELAVTVLAPRQVRVTVRDPLAMANTLAFGDASAEERATRPLTAGATPIELSFPAGPPLELAFELRDLHGNVLARAQQHLADAKAAAPCCAPTLEAEPDPGVRASESMPSAPVRKDEPRKLWRSPWLWGAISVVVVGAAVTTTVLLVRDREAEARTDVSLLGP
jgi:tetratricopeptide (TPR) repeat protein